MVAFPGHALGPGQHRLDVGETASIPVLFQNPPAPLNGIVFTVIGRKVQQLQRLTNPFYPGHQAV